MPAFDLIRHYFIPHSSNNHKAKMLHSSTLIAISFLLLLYQLLIYAVPHAGVKVLGYAANISVDDVVKLTNEKRVQAGLSPLEFNPTLSQAAKAKGEDMLAKDYWAHVAPDGTEPWKFFLDSGYKYRYAGENLARDFSSASTAVDAWMASPTHKDNLLSAKYRDIGIAVVEGDLGGRDTTIIVQLFGTRYADLPPTPSIAQKTTAVEATPPPETLANLPEVSPTPRPIPPTPTPGQTLTPAIVQQTPIQPGEAQGVSQVLVSPFTTTRGISVAVVGLLIVVFIADSAIASRRRIARIGGRTFAHISFLGMILAIAIILRAGKIL
jgi:hypothetical protein